MDQRPELRATTIKLLTENIVVNLCGLGLDDILKYDIKNINNKRKK